MQEELNVYEWEIINKVRQLEDYETLTIRRMSKDSPWAYKTLLYTRDAGVIRGNIAFVRSVPYAT